MLYRKMLEKIVAPSEMYKFSAFEDDEDLLTKFIQNDICLVLDWKQDDSEGDLIDFIQERSKIKFGKNFLPEGTITTFFQNRYPNSRSGSFLEYMLKYYDKQLIKMDEGLITLYYFDDQYRIFVVNRLDAKKLTKVKSDFWMFLNPL